MLSIKNILYLLLVSILYISFLMTGTYYLLVISLVLFITNIVSLICMLISNHKIQIKIYIKDDQLYLNYSTKYNFPYGKIKLKLMLFNKFMEENNEIVVEFLVGKTNTTISLESPLKNIGFYKLEKVQCTLYDILGNYHKKIKNIEFSDFCIEPTIKMMEGYENIQRTIKEKHSNESDEYDIKEYKNGDSIRDIHYKISFKLNKTMIKEKINALNDIIIYLDLSRNEEECRQVLTYLYYLIESVQIFQRKCTVYWHSNYQLKHVQIMNLQEYPILLKQILSLPKSKSNVQVKAHWIITSNGLFGGEEFEK